MTYFSFQFKTPDDKITTSMYTKVFGNEIAFQELTSDDWAELQEFNLLNYLIKLSEPKKIDITKNYQFLDSSLIVPTCVGNYLTSLLSVYISISTAASFLPLISITSHVNQIFIEA